MSKRRSIFQRVSLLIGDDRSSNITSDDAAAPPPAYTAVASGSDSQGGQAANAEQVSLTAAFEKLNLTNTPANPTVDACLAHLKLLFAIQWMKEDVGFTDGLWDLWDARAGPVNPALLRARPEKATWQDKQEGEPEPSVQERLQDKNLETLSRIREKRWALFVARAVDRYEAWWRAVGRCLSAEPLSEQKMEVSFEPAYSMFTENREDVLVWSPDMLPPLDVLMVWHSHMLNPRAFLEDAMLAGLRQFWATGLPWDLIDKAVDNNTFSYTVSDACKLRWARDTGLAWDNTADLMTKTIQCPRCCASVDIPWTTCGRPESHPVEQPVVLIGNGYGDGNLRQACRQCELDICKELLSVAKFVKDVKALEGPGKRPMPGTLLDPSTGRATCPPTPQTFPNRLLKSAYNSVGSQVKTALTTKQPNADPPTMEDVRKEIEKVLKDKDKIKVIDGRSGNARRYTLPPTSRIAVRKMMSRYWENFGLFALNLSGAVMRQGVFIEKMCKLDWLHSPSARETMSRLLVKYERFLRIIGTYRSKMAVPTLDVDLAWHTHQLSPSSYYHFTIDKAFRFVDHDDKIDENLLSRQFEWTSKMYQQLYGEVYSECTCWYCEAIRASHISSVGKVFGLSKQEKIAESFHASGLANLHPPSTSAHISSHNAVAARLDPLVPAPASVTANRVRVALAELHQRRLDLAYARARARAQKKGRPPPPRGDLYYDHWGYPWAYGAPYVYPLWWTPGLYYGWYPGYVVSCGAGAWGACAAGTCGGGVAAGACGGPGLFIYLFI